MENTGKIKLEEAIEKELERSPGNFHEARFLNALKQGNESAIELVKKRHGLK